jgi:gliding motility-associated-like protein
MRVFLLTLGIVLMSVFSAYAQPYNYTVEGFDNAIFPTATPGPAVETQYISPTGAWSIFKGYTVTGSDPCPTDGTNRALRFLANNSGYVLTPTLLQGAGVMTFNSRRTNRDFTYYTSTDNGATWVLAGTVNTGATACNTLSVTFNSGVINRIKIASLLTNDLALDNLLITTFTTVPPSITTTTASAITFTTATSGGNITFDGGAPVTARGVCWSTSPSPTISNSLTSNGTGVGSFTSNLAGLSPGTTYYVRAYATNQSGTGYGNEITFTTPVAVPTLTASPSTIPFGIVYQGAFSTEQSFTVTGIYLSPASGNVTITPPPGYIISLSSGSGYASSLTLPYTSGTLGPLTIYIRFSPPLYGNYDGNISINGGGAPAVSVAVTGIGSQLPQAGTLTNMGVDFWTGYGYHSRMSNNNTGSGPWMSLYISAKQAATVRVSLPGIADPSFPRTITIPANTSLEVTNFPQGDFNNNNDNPTGLPDARLYFTGITPRGIHIESLNGVPVAVYEHTYGQDAAGAMLLFPTNTWGATYNVVSLGGKSNSGVPNSFFFVMAAQDQTQIEITPTADIIDSSSATLFNSNTPAANILHAAGVPFTITLNKGQIFNAMARIVGSGSSGVSQDFTGTLVKSTDCNNKKIAVWAGNGRTFMNTSGCTVSAGSDNMVQQMFPRVAWGTKYLTTPTKTMEYGIYKICVLDPTTQVWFNNPTRTTPLTGLINNFYYQVESNSPNLIESDKPIMVIQYIITGGCKNNTFGNNGNGDPEMIILSPVQQAVNNISVFSAAKLNISNGASYINVAIKTTGVPSFKLDPVTNPTNVCDTGASSFTGTAYASAPIIPVANAFRPHPFAPGYSVAKFKVASGLYHNLVSDSGFNAIAYGMAGGESYGYNAGTAIRDLSAIVQTLNPYDTISGGKTCKGNPVRLQIAVPYLSSSIDSIKWDMGTNVNIAPNGTFMQINPVPVRTYVDNEITYSVYNMTVPVVFSATGVYRVTATIFGTFSSECGNSQLIPIDMEVVSDTARFNFTTTGCTSSVVQFTDLSTPYTGGSIVGWQWNFGDATTYNGQTPPNHTFPSIGIYNVNIRTVNNLGCFADTTRVVDLTGGLLANFGVAPDSIICSGNTITFSDSSTNTGPYGPITSWNWNFGIGANVNANTNANQTYTYNTPGTYTATLQVQTGNGCLSNIDSIHISVNAAPIITLTSAASTTTQTICVNNLGSNITYALTGGATGATLSGSLPSGMTGSFNAGVFTISGTPTVTGTFNYTVTTVSTCTNVSLSGTITVIATPTITLTSTTATTAQTLCVNDVISNITYLIGGSSTSATVTGLPAGVTGVYNAGVFTISGTPTVSGVFNYTVTTVSPCTQVSLTGSITVNALPTITLTSLGSTSSQTVCANSAIENIVYTLGGSATSATLTGTLPAGVTGTFAAGVFTISGTPTATGVFNYTVTSVSPCTNVSLSGSISVNAAPTISLSSLPATTAQTVCNNTAITNITYSIGGSGNGAAVTATLPPGVTGTFNAGVFTISGTPTASGTFNYTVSTVSPCANVSLSGSITVLAQPTIATSTPTTQTVCSNIVISNMIFTLGGSATNAAITGTLPTGVSGSYDATTSTYTISGTPTNTGTFNFTVNTVSVCTNTNINATLIVNPGPTIALATLASTTSQTVCNNAAIANIGYNIGGSGTGANVTGLPTGVTGTYNAGVFTISGTPTVSGVFNYTVNTESPCANLSLSGTITVLELPTITLTTATNTANQSICVNSVLANIAYTFAGSATNATLTGTLPTGVTGSFNAGVFTISGTPTTSGVFNYTITSVSVCNNVSLSGTITVNALPIAAFTFSNIRCTGDAVTFTDASTPNATSINQWQWNFGDGQTQTTTSPGTVTNTYATASTFPVSLIITNSNGCISTPALIQVAINPKPISSFSFTDVCIPTGSAVFTDNSIIVSGTINQWSWNFGDASPVVTTQNPTHIYANGGTYNVTLTATSALGCIKDSTRAIVVYNAPTASYTINNIGNVCSNTPLNITNTSVVNGFGTINLVEIYWDFNGNPSLVSTDNTPTAGEIYSHSYPLFGTPATITYKVLIKAYSGNGCVGEYFQDITVYAAPDVQFDLITPVCQEIPSVTLISAFDVFNNTGVGTYSGDGISTSPILIPSAAGPGNHTISYLFIASNGCLDSATQTIQVNPTPIFDLGPDRNILEGDQVTLTPLTAIGNGLSYLWSPGTYLSSVNIGSPICTPTNDITYTVNVISADGCKADDDLFIKVVRDFVVPNTFTPNGDAINDVWKIENLSLYPNYHIQVFNRYGQAMYDTKDYSKPWDGTIQGKPLPSGTYYYIIDLGGARKTKKGYVTIIR